MPPGGRGGRRTSSGGRTAGGKRRGRNRARGGHGDAQVGVKSAVGEARAKQVESAERQGDAAYSVQDHKWVPPSRYLQCSCLLFQIEGRHWHKLEEDRVRKQKASRETNRRETKKRSTVRKQKASRETNRRETKSAAPGLPAWSPTAVLPRLEPA